jgi:acetolactate synthase I/II/III large subunit
MNGAESLVATLISGGTNTCFTNPGTTELHIVAALDKRPEIRCILGLFEGVATGAADGYARMKDEPACTLLHLGPGMANGLANLHNAAKARVPIVNIVGEHASYHLHHETPLVSDIEAIARPFSHWLRTSRSAAEIGRDTAEGLAASRTPPGKIATLVVPADFAWDEDGVVGPRQQRQAASLPSQETIEHAAKILRSAERSALLLSGSALYGRGLSAAARLAGATGATLLTPYPLRRIERGAGRATVARIPYPREQGVESLKEFRQLILVGSPSPVAYFASPGKDAVLTQPDCKISSLAKPEEDIAGALEMLLSYFPSGPSDVIAEKYEKPGVPDGEITIPRLALAVAALLPENCIVVDESMTSGRGMFAAARGSAPHDWMSNTGGAIGIALPLAIGAAVASPERRVLCMSADGSGMYTLQGLWTIAREALNVTVIIFANRIYSVLQTEFSNFELGSPGPRARDLLEIGRPDLDWVDLAKGMGVPGKRVLSMEDFAQTLKRSFATEGPSLIEIAL